MICMKNNSIFLIFNFFLLFNESQSIGIDKFHNDVHDRIYKSMRIIL